MSKILITGGAGFIGSQLGRHFIKLGKEVLLLDNMTDGYESNIIFDGKPFAKLIKDDIRSKDFKKHLLNVDTIFHLAGTSSLPKCELDPAAAYDNNVTGLINVLNFSRLANIRRVIFSSTSAVYENNEKIPFLENDLVTPDLIYSSTKLAAELACKAFSKNYGMDIIIARFFNIYGEHQDIHRTMPPFISYLAKEVFFNRTPNLFNNSEASRDYVYVGDVIECLVRMYESKDHFRADIFNICSGFGHSVPEIVSAYSSVSHKTIHPNYVDPISYWDSFPDLFKGAPMSRQRIKKEVYKNSIGSTKKTEDFFKFRPQVSFLDGLKKVYEYAQLNLKDFDR